MEIDSKSAGISLNSFILVRHKAFLLKFIKYFCVGGIAAITDWGLFFYFVSYLQVHYIFSAIVAFFFATAVNYILSLFFVFKGGRYKRHHETLLVYAVSIVGAFIDLSILTILVEWISLNMFSAKVMASGIAFIWNFISRHLWVFER